MKDTIKLSVSGFSDIIVQFATQFKEMNFVFGFVIFLSSSYVLSDLMFSRMTKMIAAKKFF